MSIVIAVLWLGPPIGFMIAELWQYFFNTQRVEIK